MIPLALFLVLLGPLASGGPVKDTYGKEDVEPNLFEGDIIPTEYDDIDTRDVAGASLERMTIVKRNAQRARHYVWKTKEIPYEIDSTLIREGYQENIQAAIAQFTTHTCIKWVPHTTEENWVRFVKGRGCSSRVGLMYWASGPQELFLGNGCNHMATIMHEMMHAAGFWHEQSRPDRNQYVGVLWENIEEGKEHNFNKYSHGQIDHLTRNYDFDSLMHYGEKAFSKNGKPTIQALGDPSKQFGQRSGFSANDIIELNALYDCSNSNQGWSSWSEYGPCSPAPSCQKYRQRFCASKIPAMCPGVGSLGVDTQTEKCSDQECHASVDGHWGKWSAWGSCSVTCNRGTHTRTRLCTDPPPKNGGFDCVGKAEDTGVCEMRDCSMGPDDCHFEADGWCDWTQDDEDTAPLDWDRHTGSTPTSSTGPTEDHTSGSGYYIYFEASAPVESKQYARLLSKEFPPTQGRCMAFWFYMSGDGMGSLNVYLRDASTTKQLWGLAGDQGELWKSATIELMSSSSYQIIMEAVKGDDFRSDIAVDDITFKERSCSGSVATTEAPTPEVPTTEPSTTEVRTTKATTATPTEIPTTKASTTEVLTTEVPTPKAPSTQVSTTDAPNTGENPTTGVSSTAPSTVIPVTDAPNTIAPTETYDACDFGEPKTGYTYCTWTNDKKNSLAPDRLHRYNWWWHTGPTPSSGTGPDSDHSADGRGYYVYLEASRPYKEGNKGRLISTKVYESSPPKCLTFWYFMYGDTVRTLRVHKDDGTRLWRKRGDQGNQWRQAKVDIVSSTPFKIYFEGIRGSSYKSDIALDDILVTDGLCSRNV